MLAGTACTDGVGDGDGLRGFEGGTPAQVTPLSQVAASTPEGGLLPPSKQLTVGGSAVLDRPWPDRFTPSGNWAATVKGAGDRVALTPAELSSGTEADRGRIAGGYKLAKFRIETSTSTSQSPDALTNLLLPDGTRWYAEGWFTVDRTDDLPFSRATADGGEVQVVVSKGFGALVTGAGQVTAHGSFVGTDGRRVDQLVLPRGTKARGACATSNQTCSDEDRRPTVLVTAGANTAMVVDTGLDTEAAVAGTAEGYADGRTWTGLVAAVQGHGVQAVAIHGDKGWSLVAGTKAALQLWIDIWPVADTTLSASVGKDTGVHNCASGGCTTRVRWTNTGHASSQIFIAEGAGEGAHQVRFDLNETYGHDAGLGVGRGDRVINLSGGGDIDSNLAPGQNVDRGITRGVDPATITLRGNFPDVTLNIA